MAYIGEGETPQCAHDFVKDKKCPYCNVALKCEPRYLMVGGDCNVYAECPECSHYALGLWFRERKTDVKLESVEFKFTYNNNQYEISFMNFSNGPYFYLRYQSMRDNCRFVGCCITPLKEDGSPDEKGNVVRFTTKEEYFNRDNIDFEYMAKKVETARLLM